MAATGRAKRSRTSLPTFLVRQRHVAPASGRLRGASGSQAEPWRTNVRPLRQQPRSADPFAPPPAACPPQAGLLFYCSPVPSSRLRRGRAGERRQEEGEPNGEPPAAPAPSSPPRVAPCVSPLHALTRLCLRIRRRPEAEREARGQGGRRQRTGGVAMRHAEDVWRRRSSQSGFAAGRSQIGFSDRA